MCKFFSCISNGNGKVLFFKIQEIQKLEREGNKENYNWNSHTSIAHFNGIIGIDEDKWNKWEFKKGEKGFYDYRLGEAMRHDIVLQMRTCKICGFIQVKRINTK